ncbi:Na(+)/H(+) antiporter subunit D [Magnetovibrio sp. PR-2]|uniref:Na(+)/H(+) antiporter subunit D n=1 Tax=Magnetovibrio sp. PR-2 TaxID=3120356 RepID=UPI002FCDE8A7
MTSDVLISPSFILILGSLLLPMVWGWARSALILVLPLLTLACIWQVGDGVQMTVHFLDYQLELVEGSNLSRIFATIFAIMAFAGGLFALNQNRVIELVAAFAYAGSAIGVALAGDLITVFMYWELMAVGSTIVLWSAGTLSSGRAAMRYALVHLFGGVVLMVGVVAYIQDTGSIDFTLMGANSFATWMILIGFLINTGAPPLSAWLPDAYPEASWSGTVFLSAFTTKTAVYVLLVGFAGEEILIWIGVYMIFYGIVYALLENDMRRILSYSIVNQVGFMVVGAGIGTEMAINGAASHAFTHIIYKALLLMSAGSVMYMTGGVRKCTELGGLFRTMPLTTVAGIIGALAISSFPWTSGFVSKSMTNQASYDEGYMIVWFCLMAASAGVFLHAGIKFPWFVFFQKDNGLRPKDPPWNMRLAMVIFSFLCIWLGVQPGPLYELLPYPTDYEPYTPAHTYEMLQLLLFAGLAFFVLLPLMKRKLTITLDFDWFYRKFAVDIAASLAETTSKIISGFAWLKDNLVNAAIDLVTHHHNPRGVLARTTPAGIMVFWVVVVLLVYLVMYLFI